MGRRSDPRWRDEAAAGLMASLIPGLGLSATVLVVEDPEPAVADALTAAGAEPVLWSRMDRREGAPGSTWPPPGPFHDVLIRLPRTRESLEFALHAALSVTRPGGRVLVYGATDEGIASTPRWLAPLLGPAAVRANARRCRVLEAVWKGPRDSAATEAPGGEDLPPVALRGTLPQWRKVHEVDLGWGLLPWVSYPGTFAKGGLDPGTALLLAHLPEVPEGTRFLDFGAGTGVLAAGVLHACPGARALLVEPDSLAREAARENVPGAQFPTADGWWKSGPFHAVVANPP
ncbi:MAG TPA: methyltransferase, partial [Longimicrobiales bacterium]|nr:methyltransferase [Longimicrobiales bacterium]